MKYLTFFFFVLSSLLFGSSIQDEREERIKKHSKVTEVKGVHPKYVRKASNGNIYIKNARVYTGSKYSEDGKVSIQTGSNTRKIVIKNLKIDSRHNSSFTNNSNEGILSIEANSNTGVVVESSDIRVHNVDLKSSSNSIKSCVGALCIQSDRNSNIMVKNTNVSISSSDAILTSSAKGKKCVGAICIQTDESDVLIHDVNIRNSGQTELSINN